MTIIGGQAMNSGFGKYILISSQALVGEWRDKSNSMTCNSLLVGVNVLRTFSGIYIGFTSAIEMFIRNPYPNHLN